GKQAHMSDINPQNPRPDREQLAAATNEDSGYSIEGDTPPAEGLSVGDTNNELDVDRPGDRSKGKITVVVLAVLVAVFVILAIIGRVIGFM
uniref:DUF6480 family protein n=1 Tax=Kocuria sp. TaxID=1871328 RepID=UPI00289FC5AD